MFALPLNRIYAIIMNKTNKNIAQAEATKVLIIDDDDAMTEMLKLILEPNEFEVFITNSGPEGIKATQRIHPEVVILDLIMPDMDGWEVCKAIRSFSQVPILVISAINKPGMVAKALDEGADDYLLKPMTSSVLIAHLKRLAWRARAERQANEAKLNYLGV
jgi:two-component system KDP operon response regulator KdpE